MHMTRLMTVIETPEFIKDIKRSNMNSDEHRELVNFLAANPTAGVIMEGTGGIRKVRFAGCGQGKSGAYRVVYYYHDCKVPLFALNLFSKNEKSNLTKAERNMMKKLVQILVQSLEEEM
ncbi:type II toxin-antitoxin system RelE/ParE family toxin [Maridesulfovibrio bastinii]|uniref:type II toxin-antitoxin system RelE/ParE family toxin n=1 Tax=Maridesulfovibrio bastinii TaxID=47157 RepID=UPI000427048C|nr:type II toxin-antitoxin system RelE/ParE family toxin [Maridesulfovibrio bastinii]